MSDSIHDAAKALTGAVKDYLATIKGDSLGRRPITHKEWKKVIAASYGITKLYQKRMDEVIDYAVKKKMLSIVEKNDKKFFSIPVEIPFSSQDQDEEDEVSIEEDGVRIFVRMGWESEGQWVRPSRVERMRRDAYQSRTKMLLSQGAEEVYCSSCGSSCESDEVYPDSSGYYACGGCNDLTKGIEVVAKAS